MFSQAIKAQQPETESEEYPATATDKKADTKTDSGKLQDDLSKPESAEVSSYQLEEVIVTADRVEGDGNRRNTTAGRAALDRSDQTSMDGFFDDIDGLSTLGGDDQGNAFSIDGLSADLSNVMLNGQSFGQGRGNGGFGAGDLPPDMIRRVDVYKTPTASLEEGGAGGSVNLQLRNPVEIARASTNIKGRLGFVPDKGNFDPSASFFLGRSSENKKFGYMLNVSLSERVREYGSQDITNWVLHEFEDTVAYIPSQVRNNAVKDNNRNMFAGLTVGYKPHRSLDISANLFISQKQIDVETHGLQHRIEKQRDISILGFDGRIASELESSDSSRRNLRIVGSTREDQIDSLVLGVNINWHRKNWRVEAALGYKADNNKNDSPSQSAIFEANSAFGYSAENEGTLIMSYADGFPANQDFVASRINLSDRSTKDTNSFGGLDVTRQLGKGFIRRIRFGGKIREMSRSRRNSTARLSLEDSQTLVDFFNGQYQQTPWDTVEWPSSDMEAVNSFVQDSQIDWQENLLNVYDMKRRSNAGYLQADFRTSQEKKHFMVGNIGARIVATDTWIAGYQENDDVPEPVALKTSYTDILPSLSMRMRVAPRAALSFGVAKVMTHPSFNDLAPGIRLNFADKTARSGNPNLEPFRANQFLAELSWVPERGRRLSGNMTYRDVQSYFALGEESVEFDDDIYLVTRPINGEDGYILSASVKLDQNLRRMSKYLRDYAVSIAYTHNKSSTKMRDPYTDEKLPMPNTALHVLRINLNYSKNTFAGKLSYSWRGRSLKASVSESGLSVWNQPVGSLNLNLGWRLSGKLQLSFDARNLLNEEQARTTDRSTQLWRISERDRSIAATLRAKW